MMGMAVEVRELECTNVNGKDMFSCSETKGGK